MKKNLRRLMYFNNVVMALNCYDWWFHGDKWAGCMALACFGFLIVGAFILTRDPAEKSP